MKRKILHPKGVRFVADDERDLNWVRLWPPPKNPTVKEREAAEEVRQFINEVCIPDLKAAGLR